MKKNIDEILWELSHFTGTENYYAYKLSKRQKYHFTDGIKFLCDECECYWLLDYIISLQNHSLIKDEQFQVWRLYLVENKWHIACEDGNKKTLFHSMLDFSDFILSGVTIYLIDGIILLPSEY